MKSKKWHLGTTLLATVIFTGTMSGMAFANTGDTNNYCQANKPGTVINQQQSNTSGSVTNKEVTNKSIFNKDIQQQDSLNDAAKVLRMSVDKLKAELKSGKKIEKIVVEKGMTMEQFNKKMQELRKNEVSQKAPNKDQKMIQGNGQHSNNISSPNNNK